MKPDLLAPYVQSFFREFLVAQRNVSRNTLLSYRDAFRLLLEFASQHQSRPVPDLLIDDVGPETVLAFLDHLELDRGNTITTRNARAAAIRMFFRYLAGRHPSAAELCRRVAAIPRKRCAAAQVGYLETDELQAIFSVIDRSMARGRRDYTMLWLLYDTGARVQEILDSKVGALHLLPPEQIRLFGKGRKERLCPLSCETAAVLRDYLDEHGIAERADTPLFIGRHGQPMSRSGVARMIKRYVGLAAQTMPSLRDRTVTPHSVRHTPF